jgi:hypothetical protein
MVPGHVSVLPGVAPEPQLERRVFRVRPCSVRQMPAAAFRSDLQRGPSSARDALLHHLARGRCPSGLWLGQARHRAHPALGDDRRHVLGRAASDPLLEGPRRRERLLPRQVPGRFAAYSGGTKPDPTEPAGAPSPERSADTTAHPHQGRGAPLTTVGDHRSSSTSSSAKRDNPGS